MMHGVISQVAATRLQNKLSELGRPESEINAARQIVREAAHKVKNVHKRFGSHVVRVRKQYFHFMQDKLLDWVSCGVSIAVNDAS